MNRLAQATSPYLRQHAGNPVHWQEWGADAFAEARDRDVPIFLSIGYASCHWCHVMAHESFADEGVARLLNDNFVSIKVDREERPDVDAIYMAAAQALTGHGGWPLSVILGSDGRPFHAGTYYPREQLLDLFTQANAAWQHHRADALAFTDQLTNALQQALGIPGQGAGPAPGTASQLPRVSSGELPISRELLDSTIATLSRDFDREHPGFGQAPKFPPSATLIHLIRMSERTGNQHASAMAQQIGDAMARGGIHDQLAGGFARYSVDRAWRVPHFEKMLYDNAQLLRGYAELWRISEQPIFRRAAYGIVEFLHRDLRVHGGALASALDADTEVKGEAVEGATYVWTPAQLNAALGLQGGTLAAELFHVHVDGNFEHGTSVLQLPREPKDVVARITAKHADAPIPPRAAADPDAWYAEIRATLLAERQQRPQPTRDDKVVTSWNGLAIAALCEAGTIFAEDSWIAWAADIADYLWSVHRAEGRWRRASIDGSPGLADATADDLGNLAEGFLALHAAGQGEMWAARAREMLDHALATYAVRPEEPGRDGFFDVPEHLADGIDLLVRPRNLIDLAEPCGTSALADALWRYDQQAGTDGTYAQAARRAVAAMAEHALTTPRFAGWALATAEAIAANHLDQ